MCKKVSEWIKALEDGGCDDKLKELYGADYLEKQKERYKNALLAYRSEYGEDEVSVFSAPGRTEIGGNHTDHQHGKVLAASIDLDVVAVASPIKEQKICIKSEGYPAFVVGLDQLAPEASEEGSSRGLVRGVAASLKEMGYNIGGFRAYMTSDVLGGSGLSSSAAFEVTVGAVLSGLYNENRVTAVELAIAGQKAENVFFGKPCGLMDQMASAVGGLIQIDFKDPARPVIRQIEENIGANGYDLCIVDTKGSHADLTDDYAAVPAEMKSVAAFLGAEVLREIPEEEFYGQLPKVREELGDRAVLCAIHFYQEEARVEEEAAALQENDMEAFLDAVRRSGASSIQYLQNVFSSHDVRHQGITIALAAADLLLKGRGVSRVHGGGFAGTMQAFVPKDLTSDYKEEMNRIFGEGSCYVLKIRPAGGIQVL